MRSAPSRPFGAPGTTAALIGCLAAAGCADEARIDYAAVFDGTAGRWVDLSWSFGPSTVYWPSDTLGFRLSELAFGRTDAGYFYSSYDLGTAEHGGTHLDAPIHFAEGGLSTDEIPLAGLIGPAAVVDVREQADADYRVSVADLEGWEARHGKLPNGGILLLRTGWGARWTDRAAYLGTEAIGPDAIPQLHFPGLAPEAAQWLVDRRGIVAVGIDTPSIDYGQSTDFASHVTLYSANISGFENVAHLELMPEQGAFVVALPMKIEGGSGGPLRIVGFVPSPRS
jgi:kynurenine formamidase